MKFSKTSISFLMALMFLASAPAFAAAGTAADMTKAAGDFLSQLKPEQRAKASFDLKSDERANWHFIPKDRNGLPFKEMTGAQRDFAKKLLQSGLSKEGFGKVTNIMSLELVLFDLENKNPKRDPELYYVSIFGIAGPPLPTGDRRSASHAPAS